VQVDQAGSRKVRPDLALTCARSRPGGRLRTRPTPSSALADGYSIFEGRVAIMLRVPPDRLSRRQWLLSSGALASAAARPQPASRANLNIYFGDLHNHA